MWRPAGGASRLTYRRLLDLIDGLPAESRTKTAQRDLLDPFELAAMASGDPGRGWGEHGRLHELLCLVGEAVDRVGYYVCLANAGDTKPKEPPRWRRPGVLSEAESALVVDPASLEVRSQLEAEREDLRRRRAAKRAAKKAAAAAQETTTEG